MKRAIDFDIKKIKMNIRNTCFMQQNVPIILLGTGPINYLEGVNLRGKTETDLVKKIYSNTHTLHVPCTRVITAPLHETATSNGTTS